MAVGIGRAAVYDGSLCIGEECGCESDRGTGGIDHRPAEFRHGLTGRKRIDNQAKNAGEKREKLLHISCISKIVHCKGSDILQFTKTFFTFLQKKKTANH
jgi:hypothetical protein